MTTYHPCPYLKRQARGHELNCKFCQRTKAGTLCNHARPIERDQVSYYKAEWQSTIAIISCSACKRQLIERKFADYEMDELSRYDMWALVQESYS